MDKSQAEVDILIAADRWARETMRQEKYLDPVEQSLLDAILVYQRLTRSLPDNLPVEIPKPPYLPPDLKETITSRYSDIPTSPGASNELEGTGGYNTICDFDSWSSDLGDQNSE
jgi:hypothetical protein